MIEQLIKKENIVVNAHADSWQQAINLSLQQLVKNGYCTDEYETAVLKSTEENKLSLITCIANKRNQRLCVQATEKRY